MISRDDILRVLDTYDEKNTNIAVIGSHSGLDVCDGAAEEGFRTLAVCQKGREKTYSNYFKCFRDSTGKPVRGVVDQTWVFPKFADIIEKKNQERLRKNNCLFVPNRSFTSYCGIEKIEYNFFVPLIGSRNLLRSEERGDERDYYWILEKAGLPFPEKINDPRDIDELCIVKLPHAKKKLERGFFTAASYNEYEEKATSLLKQGVITKEALDNARIERYVIGPVFNFDFFYSPLAGKDEEKVELLGIDWRFETSLDGHVRLPAPQQMTLPEHQITPEFTVCGHNSATLRESGLEKIFELAETYVKATKKYYLPGMIGPFCLQTCIDKDLKPYIYDVAPRVGGGTNIHMSVGHPYGNTLWRKPMSSGRRLAMEVRRAIETGELNRIVT